MRTSVVALLLVACGRASSPSAEVDRDDADREDFAPPVELGRHAVEIGEPRKVIPGTGLPAEARAQTSNNNLDVVRHEGRVFLAFRTAPNHFASKETALYVISSDDERTWRFETEVRAEVDLREPRLFSFGGSLFLYVARLGTDPVRFQPQGMSYVERGADGRWGSLVDFGEPTFIPWRAKVERGTPFLVAYDRGEQIYAPSGIPLSVHLFTTDDGRTFRPFDPARSAVLVGGASETDFVIGDDGTLFAVARNEAGDETGFGSKVCRAAAGSMTTWSCKSDPRKYDSPRMFWFDGEAYLVGRRNLSPTGDYDLEEIRDRPLGERWFKNQIDYKNWPKRCALWRYVQSEDRIAFVADLPSRGDTCFPAVLEGNAPGEFVIYDYSSPIDGPDLPWNEGQVGPTSIYRHVVRFTRR
jgi:hypothetical protein